VVHWLARPTAAEPPRAGFVTGRRVGSAVDRNLVRRRLQHLVAARLPTVPAGTLLVVRALPGSAQASNCQLGDALDAALRAATSTSKGRRASSPPAASSFAGGRES
jgi:ribonuclease P protein component